MKIIEDIKPRGIASAYIDAPFDKGKEALEKERYEIISLEENAELRMQEGKDAFISRNGNGVKEDVLYVPKKGKFLTKISPIMANAEEATNCHRKGVEYYLTDEQVEQSLSDSVLLSVKSVPTNRFRECDITVYAFGDLAGKYGEFLREAGIEEMLILTVDLEGKPFARKLWFRGLDNRSDFFGYIRYLCNDNRARGVRKSAGGTAENLDEHVSERIKEALRILNITGIEGILLSELRKDKR